jgi:hypothetical protein
VDNVCRFAQAPRPRSECRAGVASKYDYAHKHKKDGHRVRRTPGQLSLHAQEYLLIRATILGAGNGVAMI